MKEALFKREAYLEKIRGFYHEADLIKVLTGVRRCGKSSLMSLISSEIKEQGVEDEAIIYINLEETSKRKIKTADALEKLILQELRLTDVDSFNC